MTTPTGDRVTWVITTTEDAERVIEAERRDREQERDDDE